MPVNQYFALHPPSTDQNGSQSPSLAPSGNTTPTGKSKIQLPSAGNSATGVTAARTNSSRSPVASSRRVK